MTEKKRDDYSRLFMIGAVALVAVVALVLNGMASGLEGAVPATTKTTEYQAYCSDDDPKDDFYVVGTTQMGTELYADSCLDKDILLQHYCSSGRNVKTRRPYTCPNGCLDGACLR